jgi:DNA-binding transcriptional MerR regulator
MTREFGVTARALRFYEDKGLIAPHREGLNRIYGARERARLTLILRGKKIGFSLGEIKEALDLYDLEDGKRVQLESIIEKFRHRLAALKSQRIELDKTIQTVEQDIVGLEARIAEVIKSEAGGAPPSGQTGSRRLEETS